MYCAVVVKKRKLGLYRVAIWLKMTDKEFSVFFIRKIFNKLFVKKLTYEESIELLEEILKGPKSLTVQRELEKLSRDIAALIKEKE